MCKIRHFKVHVPTTTQSQCKLRERSSVSVVIQTKQQHELNVWKEVPQAVIMSLHSATARGSSCQTHLFFLSMHNVCMHRLFDRYLHMNHKFLHQIHIQVNIHDIHFDNNSL